MKQGWRSGDNVRRQLVLERRKTIAQDKLALLETLHLKLVCRADRQQRVDRGIEIAMFLPQAFAFVFKRGAFAVRQSVRHALASETPVSAASLPSLSAAYGRKQASGASVLPPPLWRKFNYHARQRTLAVRHGCVKLLGFETKGRSFA